MTRGWGWRGVGIAVLVLLAGWLLVPLITLHSAKTRILAAVQAELGRRVQADTVRLRLLPRPGVELDNLRVGEDPAFGAEDMVIADDATAAVRVLPLFTGRLVFARIHLDDASINLVRNRAGNWNIAALLERSHPRAGAGGGAGGGGRVAPFPYLDWSDARINFKLDQTKTRLYLDQVQGALAHDDQGWRLHAAFMPERTDLNLSNPGNVTLDGRWPTAATPREGFRQRPFSVEVRLTNSYLAASSALLAGHDAGVHGVLAARLEIAPAAAGNGGLQISGTAAVQSLRRWDLMPPPVSLQGDFAGVYWPGQDRFELSGLGDPGWKQVRIAGTVNNVFSGLSLDLHAALNQLPAASLWPLAVALKSGLPAGVQVSGAAQGTAAVQWAPWDPRQPQPQISADVVLSGLGFTSVNAQLPVQLRVPTLQFAGKASRLRLAPATAQLSTGGAAAIPVSVSGDADPSGFHLKIAAAALTRAASQSLSRLFGLQSPWPASLTGVAQVHLGLDGRWSALHAVAWSGTTVLSKAHFQPPDGPGLDLSGVRVTVADARPAQIALTAQLPASADAPATAPAASASADDALAITLTTPVAPAAPWQFTAHAGHLDATALWRWLQPPPQDLLQRVFGASPSSWLGTLAAQGPVQVGDVAWHGRHAALRMQLAGHAGIWQASGLELHLAGGVFSGQGVLNHGQYTISGAVAAAQPLDVVTLLAGTPYQGWASGSLSGTLHLTRPAGSLNMAAVDAEGDFELRDGRLATATGARRFQRWSGHFVLSHGQAQLTGLVWVAGGERWRGQGSARTGLSPAPRLSLELHPDRPHTRRTQSQGETPLPVLRLQSSPQPGRVPRRRERRP